MPTRVPCGGATRQAHDADSWSGALPSRFPTTSSGASRSRQTCSWGRHDRFVPLGLAEGASARLDWPLHVIDEAGHVPHIERPDAFLRALRSALDTSGMRRKQ